MTKNGKFKKKTKLVFVRKCPFISEISKYIAVYFPKITPSEKNINTQRQLVKNLLFQSNYVCRKRSVNFRNFPRCVVLSRNSHNSIEYLKLFFALQVKLLTSDNVNTCLKYEENDKNSFIPNVFSLYSRGITKGLSLKRLKHSPQITKYSTSN